MKNFKKLFIIFSIVFFMSGCYKSEMTLTINSDKSVEINAKILVEDDFKESNYSKNTDLYDKREIKIDRINESNIKGFSINKKYSNINDISSEDDVVIDISKYLDANFEDENLFKVNKNYLKNQYTAHFMISNDYIKNNFNIRKETKEEFIEIIKDVYNKSVTKYGKEKKEKIYSSENTDLEVSTDVKYKVTINKSENVFTLEISDEYYSYNKENFVENEIVEADIVKLGIDIEPGIKFVVKLPNKVLNSNANEVSTTGKTLTWILNSNSTNDIIFTFELSNKENYFKIFGTIFGITLLIIILIYAIIKLKNKIRKNEENKPIYVSEENKPNTSTDDVPEVISIDDDNTTI